MQLVRDEPRVNSWSQPRRRFAFRPVESPTNGPGRAAHTSCGCDAGPSSRLWGAALSASSHGGEQKMQRPRKSNKTPKWQQTSGRLLPSGSARDADSKGTFYCPLMSEAKRFYLSLLPGFTWTSEMAALKYGCVDVCTAAVGFFYDRLRWKLGKTQLLEKASQVTRCVISCAIK